MSARRAGLITAIRDAIAHEMERDATVVVMGVDAELGPLGSVRGLHARFGSERVRSTPITEYAVTGAAAGAAMTGLRPIVDLHFSNFLYTAWDQLANQVAKLPYMTNGQLSLPLVLLACTGAAGSNAAQHSDCPTASLMNLGALDVVYPSTPEDAAGLMTAAIRSPRPIVFLYPLALSSERGDAFEVGSEIPLGSARIRRTGEDVTCWASGAMAKKALEAAARVADQGVSVEVIDPRTLAPLDVRTVLESVAKTGRLVAVDEGHASCSAASEIIARVVSEGFGLLRTAPVAVTSPANTPVPYAPVLEREVVPSVDRIAAALRAVTTADIVEV